MTAILQVLQKQHPQCLPIHLPALQTSLCQKMMSIPEHTAEGICTRQTLYPSKKKQALLLPGPSKMLVVVHHKRMHLLFCTVLQGQKASLCTRSQAVVHGYHSAGRQGRQRAAYTIMALQVSHAEAAWDSTARCSDLHLRATSGYTANKQYGWFKRSGAVYFIFWSYLQKNTLRVGNTTVRSTSVEVNNSRLQCGVRGWRRVVDPHAKLACTASDLPVLDLVHRQRPAVAVVQLLLYV